MEDIHDRSQVTNFLERSRKGKPSRVDQDGVFFVLGSQKRPMRYRYNEPFNPSQSRELNRAFGNDARLGLYIRTLSELIADAPRKQIGILNRSHKADWLKKILSLSGVDPHEMGTMLPNWNEDAAVERISNATLATAIKTSGLTSATQAEANSNRILIANDVMVSKRAGDTQIPLFKPPKFKTSEEWDRYFAQLYGGPDKIHLDVVSAIATAPRVPEEAGLVSESIHQVILAPLSRKDRRAYQDSMSRKLLGKPNGGFYQEHPIIRDHLLSIDGVSYTSPQFESAYASLLRSLLGVPDCIYPILGHLIAESPIPTVVTEPAEESHHFETFIVFRHLESLLNEAFPPRRPVQAMPLEVVQTDPKRDFAQRLVAQTA